MVRTTNVIMNSKSGNSFHNSKADEQILKKYNATIKKNPAKNLSEIFRLFFVNNKSEKTNA